MSLLRDVWRHVILYRYSSRKVIRSVREALGKTTACYKNVLSCGLSCTPEDGSFRRRTKEVGKINGLRSRSSAGRFCRDACFYVEAHAASSPKVLSMI